MNVPDNGHLHRGADDLAPPTKSKRQRACDRCAKKKSKYPPVWKDPEGCDPCMKSGFECVDSRAKRGNKQATVDADAIVEALLARPEMQLLLATVRKIDSAVNQMLTFFSRFGFQFNQMSDNQPTATVATSMQATSDTLSGNHNVFTATTNIINSPDNLPTEQTIGGNQTMGFNELQLPFQQPLVPTTQVQEGVIFHQNPADTPAAAQDSFGDPQTQSTNVWDYQYYDYHL